MKPKGSFRDSKGRLYVDCAECHRGGNGNDPEKCSSGWQTKQVKRGGCFSGELIEKYEIPEVPKT